MSSGRSRHSKPNCLLLRPVCAGSSRPRWKAATPRLRVRGRRERFAACSLPGPQRSYHTPAAGIEAILFGPQARRASNRFARRPYVGGTGWDVHTAESPDPGTQRLFRSRPSERFLRLSRRHLARRPLRAYPRIFSADEHYRRDGCSRVTVDREASAEECGSCALACHRRPTHRRACIEQSPS